MNIKAIKEGWEGGCQERERRRLKKWEERKEGSKRGWKKNVKIGRGKDGREIDGRRV